MKLLIYGILGKMGRNVYTAAAADPRVTKIIGVDRLTDSPFPGVKIYASLNDVEEKPDCLIDFSVKEALNGILSYAIQRQVPCVLATTGYTETDYADIRNAARFIPVFQTGNMSLGVNVLLKLVKEAAKRLNGLADVEIIETHHNQKVDAPSGTALMLYDAVKAEKPDAEAIYGREGIIGKRTPDEVALHAVRGGTVVGKHDVEFLMNSEVITLRHEAESKMIFANGSLNAAFFLQGRTPGYYSMDDLLQI